MKSWRLYEEFVQTNPSSRSAWHRLMYQEIPVLRRSSYTFNQIYVEPLFDEISESESAVYSEYSSTVL